MIHQFVEESNLTRVIDAMPSQGRRHLAWLLAKGVISCIDGPLTTAVERVQMDEARFSCWAEEWDNRHSLEK
jgi:hypothetical protein